MAASSISDRLEDLYDDVRDALVGNQRQLDLEQWAERNGYSYKRRISIRTLDFGVRSLKLFKNKKRTRIYHVLIKAHPPTESTLEIFDSGIRGGNKKVTTSILVDSALLNLPRFRLRPKKALEKMTSVFSSQDDPLSISPPLQKQVTLQTNHPEYMERYLTQRFADVMLSNPGLTLEGLDNWLMVYREGKTIEVEDLLAFTQLITEITEILLFDHSNELL